MVEIQLVGGDFPPLKLTAVDDLWLTPADSRMAKELQRFITYLVTATIEASRWQENSSKSSRPF